MKVAVPLWNGCVSNVFDFAHRLLLVDIEHGKEVNRSEIALEGKWLPQRAIQLKNLGIDVLVCGAISQELANMIVSAGIEILPFVTGNIENVLAAYMAGQLTRSEFSMPGCRPGLRKGFGQRQGCRWRGGHR